MQNQNVKADFFIKAITGLFFLYFRLFEKVLKQLIVNTIADDLIQTADLWYR